MSSPFCATPPWEGLEKDEYLARKRESPTAFEDKTALSLTASLAAVAAMPTDPAYTEEEQREQDADMEELQGLLADIAAGTFFGGEEESLAARRLARHTLETLANQEVDAQTFIDEYLVAKRPIRCTLRGVQMFWALLKYDIGQGFDGSPEKNLVPKLRQEEEQKVLDWVKKQALANQQGASKE